MERDKGGAAAVSQGKDAVLGCDAAVWRVFGRVVISASGNFSSRTHIGICSEQGTRCEARGYGATDLSAG